MTRKIEDDRSRHKLKEEHCAYNTLPAQQLQRRAQNPKEYPVVPGLEARGLNAA
jgi:hypothetical protein